MSSISSNKRKHSQHSASIKRIKLTPDEKTSLSGFEAFSMSQEEQSYSQIFSSHDFNDEYTNEKPSRKLDPQEVEIEKMVEEESRRIDEMSQTTSEENRQLYMYFNDLQVIAKEYNLDVKIPELVVVGLQSNGKSSFVEALLGFQFNTVETQIGTRRPLILQMSNNPSRETPYCIFYKEDLSGLESEPIQVSQIEAEIKRRTEALCGKDKVSSKPIFLRVEYKYCANLTIYDTPGFRKGKNDILGEKIMRMVSLYMKEKHRIIVCLEQSTVEWCNVEVRPIVEQVDPDLSRTILITTKFNNRVNQFKNKKEVDMYFNDSGCLRDKKMFFISLPSGRNARDLTEDEFKQKLKEVHLSDFKTLCELNVDKRYLEFVGIHRTKRYLEKLLNRKYKENLQPVLSKIEFMFNKSSHRLSILRKEIGKVDVNNMGELASKVVTEYIMNVHSALKGTTKFDTLKNGFTLEEEKSVSGITNWPNYNLNYPIRNAKYKLYGGAQLERLLSEFEVVAHCQEFPATTDDEVAVTIGLNSLHTTPDYDRGASDLAQKKCRSIFRPLIAVLLERSKFIMQNLFKTVISYMESNKKYSMFTAFFAELQKISEEFVESVLLDVRKKTNDEFDTFTKIMDWDLMGFCSSPQNLGYDLLNPKPEDTLKRVQSITEEQPDKFQFFSNDRSRELTPERCQKIKTVAAKLFAGVRLLFVKYVRAKYNAFFIDPIFTKLDNVVRMHFAKLGEEKLKELMGYNITRMKELEARLEQQVKRLSEQKEKYKALEQKIQSNT